jgi:CheY-like chemotaxis protein
MGVHHILLVEDNPGDVRLIQESLRTYAIPYRLTLYETADAAIDALARCGANGSGVPDLILLDYNVPRGDALDILSAASRNPALAAVPKIVVSSSVSPRDRDQALALGASRFINKPVTLDSFLTEVGTTIVELLGRH